MRRWSFTKGHGTENDFVLLLDREAMLDLSPDEVRFLCDRHPGIGADGLLRVVAARPLRRSDGRARRPGRMWFMDYRNADGSLAEMCGNGVRVFARYLLDHGLASGRTFRSPPGPACSTVSMLPDGSDPGRDGPGRPRRHRRPVTDGGRREFTAVAADVGNPHAVSFVDAARARRLPLWTPRRAGSRPRSSRPG